MLVRTALALAAVTIGSASAQPYAPPGMSWGPGAPAPAPASADPVLAPTTTTPSRWEWAFGAGAGPRSGEPWTVGDRGPSLELELTRLARLGPRLVAGAMLTLPWGVAGVAGWRLHLAPAVRVDLLADAGLARLNEPDARWGPVSGASWLPVTGARAAVGWVGHRQRRSASLGLAVRRAWPRTERTCDVSTGACDRDRRGGTFVGAVLTYGSVGTLPASASAGGERRESESER